MKQTLLFAVLLVLAICLQAQNNKLPFSSIESYPTQPSMGAVAARMVQGLGFRYHWASVGLRSQDLAYSPSSGARSCQQTLVHIYQLSFMVLDATQQTTTRWREATDYASLPYDSLRSRTLHNLQQASDNMLKASDAQLQTFTIRVAGPNGEQGLEVNFWHLFNGPIADALWHVGQVVSFRRASGNPINEKVCVLMGRLRE